MVFNEALAEYLTTGLEEPRARTRASRYQPESLTQWLKGAEEEEGHPLRGLSYSDLLLCLTPLSVTPPPMVIIGVPFRNRWRCHKCL